MTRKLGLRQEALADLAPDQLVTVGGASGLPCDLTRHTCLPTCDCTGYYPSINAPCDSAHC